MNTCLCSSTSRILEKKASFYASLYTYTCLPCSIIFQDYDVRKYLRNIFSTWNFNVISIQDKIIGNHSKFSKNVSKSCKNSIDLAEFLHLS